MMTKDPKVIHRESDNVPLQREKQVSIQASPKPKLSTLDTHSENQPSIKPLTKLDLGEYATGYYCDPLSGDCYPASEMKQQLQKENPMTIAIDPVCKMEVEFETAQYKSEHAGETYYFCSAGCQKSFEKDPHQYLPEEHHKSSHHSHEGHSH